MITIRMGRAGESGMGVGVLDRMFRLRAEVFAGRLGWAVQVRDGREHDWFDVLGPRYLLLQHGQAGRVLGCCRLLPTTGPNMLRDVFPELLDGAPAPSGEEVLEVSRFAVDQDCTRPGLGFSVVPAALVAAALHGARKAGARRLVGVTSLAFERMLRGLGLRVQRLGRPRRIGEVMSLAFELPLDAANLACTEHRLPQATDMPRAA
jgi:acyl homoserine lactone synthase